MMSELIRFFDHELKGWDTGLEKEQPIQYYTMGEGKWKSSDVWPPASSELTPLYFSTDQKLIWKSKTQQHDSLLAEMRFWGDSVNAMQSRGILKKLEGEGIVDGEAEHEMSLYREADETYRKAEALMQSLTYEFRQERSKAIKPDTLVVNHEAGSGPFSRYRSLAGRLKTAQVYPDRKSRDSLNLVLETEPLPADLEVTGHPIFECFLSSTTNDAQLFVYLEDVDENGNVSYVTEGLFRAIHRKITSTPFYEHPAPQHSYLAKDAMPLEPGIPEKITFDLWPTSYQFKKGHKIRVSIAGADKDHFRNMTGDTPTYVFYNDFEKSSKLLLPLVK
jgi:predicted acyl esterase